jgi:hypothetical protein
MGNGTPSITGDVPSGATMRPRYMGRVMNTYPVSEPEMENISSLSAQTTIRFSVASLLLGLASSIWINATFYTDLTPEGRLASHYVAPAFLVFALGFAVGGIIAYFKRGSAWERIKTDSIPLQAIAPAREMVVTSEPQP